LFWIEDDGIFFLDQQPCRTVRVVGWVTAISFEPVHKDAVDSDVKVAVTSESLSGFFSFQLIPFVTDLNTDLTINFCMGDSRRPGWRIQHNSQPDPQQPAFLHPFESNHYVHLIILPSRP